MNYRASHLISLFFQKEKRAASRILSRALRRSWSALIKTPFFLPLPRFLLLHMSFMQSTAVKNDLAWLYDSPPYLLWMSSKRAIMVYQYSSFSLLVAKQQFTMKPLTIFYHRAKRFRGGVWSSRRRRRCPWPRGRRRQSTRDRRRHTQFDSPAFPQRLSISSSLACPIRLMAKKYSNEDVLYPLLIVRCYRIYERDR